MCGIAGIRTTNPSVHITPQQVQLAINSMAHRGPDHQGFFTTPHLQVGHARLSVIDPSESANQPMTCDQNRYVLVFNGEIYNFKPLRAELNRLGIAFKTQSDTEVLLHALIQYGADALPKLNGCFAFAFADTVENTLLLARDRMGIKPLWYALPDSEGTVCFASEAKALNQLAPNTPLNPEALPFYLRFNYLPTSISFFKGFHKLPPGHLLKASGTEVEIEQWYDLSATFTAPAPTETSLFNLLSDAVQIRLIADVPLGTFLSGGVDSSIVSALAAKAHAGIETFSIGFEGGKRFDETPVAEQVAKHIHSKHHAFHMGMTELAEEARLLASSLDEPFADSSALPMSFLSRQTRQFVKVALSGDGADELFAGYQKHRGHLKAVQLNGGIYKSLGKIALMCSPIHSSRSNTYSNQIRKLRKFAEGLQLNAEDRYLLWAAFAQNEFLEACGLQPSEITPLLPHNTCKNELQQVLLYDQTMVLPNDMLHKVDLMSMRHSLEVRTPFLDHRVVAYANGLREDQKYGKYQGKIILRETFKELLPPFIFERSKQGFEIPLEQLLLSALREEIGIVAQINTLENLGIPQPKPASQMINSFLSGSNPGLAPTVWALYILSSWLKNRQTEMN